MTREEQIKKAEIKYSDKTLFDGCDYIGQYAKQEAFTAGAEWADEHPKPGMVNKQEFIEKACKWLKENLFEGYNPDNYPMVRCYNIDLEDFVKEFHREMEE